MSRMKLINCPYLITLLLLKLLSQPSTANNTSCDASFAVESYPSTINCHFQEDPSIRRNPIRILRYDFEKPTSQPELMLVCSWENSDLQPKCTTSSSSITHAFKGREASITFGSTYQKHAGIYKCQVNGDKESQSCNLHVRKAETSCTDVTVTEGETAEITCNFNSDLSKTHDDFYVQWFPKDSPFETALSCNWQGPGDDDWICKAKDPFTFNAKAIKETVTLRLKPGMKILQGELLCSVVLYTDAIVNAKRCSVDVGQHQTTNYATQPSAERSTESLISYSMSVFTKSDTSSTMSISAKNIIFVVAPCIILLFILLACLIIPKTRQIVYKYLGTYKELAEFRDDTAIFCPLFSLHNCYSYSQIL